MSGCSEELLSKFATIDLNLVRRNQLILYVSDRVEQMVLFQLVTLLSILMFLSKCFLQRQLQLQIQTTTIKYELQL